MYARVFCLALAIVACLVASAFAGPISYTYIYDTVDGTGAGAYQPQTSGVAADSGHNDSFTTYSSGELNDGYSFVGNYGSNFWNTGYEVGTKNLGSPASYPAPSIVAALDPSQTWSLGAISVNYVVELRIGIHAPSSATVYFSADGTNWSSGTAIGGWNDTNPSDPTATLAIADLYMNNIDVSGISAAHSAKYVRLDIGSTEQWGGLVEVGFSTVPEPSSLILLASGLIGILAYAWRKRW